MRLDAAISTLREPEAPWRTRGTVTLTETLLLAGSAGVRATVQSCEYSYELLINLEIHTSVSPTLAVLRSRGLHDVSVRATREVDAGVFEMQLPVAQRSVRTVLCLARENHSVEVPLIIGDHAAVIEHGWHDSSAGKGSEIRVDGHDLSAALVELRDHVERAALA